MQSEGNVTVMITRRKIVQTAVVTIPAALLESQDGFAASDAAEIDRNAAAALRRLYATDHRTRDLGQRAAGILVFPKIVKAGFILGAQGGKGVLREHDRVRGYYTIAAGSFGLQAGVQWFSYALFFMDPEALHYLDKSDGWAVGSDPSVVVIDKGAGLSVTSTTLAKKVIAVPFGQKGLMAGLALDGSKITTYNPSA